MKPLTPAQRQKSLDAALSHWDSRSPVWVFGYGSLVWRPEFKFDTKLAARVFGYHRSLCLWSFVHRGTPRRPGLVLGLAPGGSCQGIAHRIARSEVERELAKLWKREMVSGAYRPRWLHAHISEAGRVIRQTCLTFVMDPRSGVYARNLSDAKLLRTVRAAHGARGSNTEYVLATARCLAEHGIIDVRLMALARSLSR